MSKETNYKNIVAVLSGIESKIVFLKSLRGLTFLIGLVIILFALLTFLTAFSWPTSAIRIGIDIVIAVILGSAVYRYIIAPFLDKRGLLPIARLLEKQYGRFQTRLIAALELYDIAKKNKENYSLELIEKTINEAGGFIDEIDAEVIIDKKPAMSAAVKTTVLSLAAVILLLTNPSLTGRTWQLYSHPGADIIRPPDFSLSIEPTGGEFFRNEDIIIAVRADGKNPREVELHFKFDDGEWAREKMRANQQDGKTVFDYTFNKIQRSIEVYAVSKKVRTETARLEVVDPPRLVNINLKIDFPDYTGLPDVLSEPNDGNVTALKGSVVSFTSSANKSISNAYQVFSDSTRTPLRVEDRTISGEFTVKDDNRYSIMMTDENGRENREPIWYDIQILDDYPPSIQIMFPAVDVDLNERMILPLEVAISDDYGFGRMNLVWWVLSEGRESRPSKEKIKLTDKSSANQVIRYTWDLKPLNPLPGDLIYYYCEISDNDIISGPKWAKSRTYLARLPSLDEILAEVDHSREYQIEELEEVMKDQRELQEKLDEISREMLKATEIDWEKQQAARETLEKQQDLAERLQDLAEEMEKNFETLEENNLMSQEIAEKMREIQKLMEEVATPEMKEAMEKIRRALEEMDPDELREALENFQMSSEELLENLERSLSLLKQLAIEQKLDLLTELAEKILEDQRQLNENVNSAKDSSDLANQNGMCQKNSDQFDSLKDQFEQLRQMDSEMDIVPDKEELEADKQINNPEIPEDFKSMSKGMCENSGSQCEKSGKQLEKNLENVVMTLQNARSAMQQMMKEEIARELQEAIDDILYLSGLEENLLAETRSLEGSAEELRDFADEQANIASAAERIAELMSEVSKKTVFMKMSLLRLMGDLLESLTGAYQSLDNRNAKDAILNESMALSKMNTLALMLLDTKKECSGSSSGSGMSEMMNKMGQISQKQSKLNQKTQSLFPTPNMTMSPSQQKSLQQLAAQQESLRQQMGELSDKFGERGEMLGRLDALAEEMKKVVEDFSRNRVDRRTLERQERILSRLLDAQKSVNRREYSMKRKSRLGRDIARRSPVLDGRAGDRDGWLSGIAEKALRENYPRKYEKLIKAYFKSLQNEGAVIER